MTPRGFFMMANGFFPSRVVHVEEERCEHKVGCVHEILDVVREEKLDNLCIRYTSLRVVTPYIVGERIYDSYRGGFVVEEHLFYIKDQDDPAVYANYMANLAEMGCQMSFLWRWKGLRRLKKMTRVHSGGNMNPLSMKKAVANYKNGLKLG